MNNLALVKSDNFGSVKCDFYKNDNKEILMTREQIGSALEYADPITAITKIHKRHEDRLNKLSVVTKLVGTDGKNYDTYLYTAKGIYEICRWSQQNKANEFYDWVYEALEALRKGETFLIKPQTEEAKLLIQKQRAEAMLLNARTRQAKLILDMQKNKILSPVAIELLGVNALEIITDQQTAYRPEVEKTYTATEIANELGVSAMKIGKVSNANNLKSAEFGISVLDKSRYSSKQVSSFRYNEKGKQKLIEIMGKC
jgi:prophage antirepressor-like protein